METDVEPAAPGVEVGFEGDKDGYEFQNDGHDVPE